MTQGGKTHIRQEGFTITEVLIVLAVTGFLFFTAFIYINGRQNRTEFQVGIRQVQQQFQQVINEVASGYYPDTAGFTCTPTATSITLSTSATQQGSKKDCIFVGKALVASNTRGKNLGVYSLAGARLNAAKQDVTTLLEAKPVAIAPTTVNSSFPNGFVADMKLPNSIVFNRASVVRDDDSTAAFPAGGSGAFGIAVVSSLADFANGNAASQQSATQTLQLYYLHSSAWAAANTPLKEADAINAEATAAMPDNWGYRLKQAQYCFSSGTTDQSGLITVGSGSGLTVDLDIKNGTSC